MDDLTISALDPHGPTFTADLAAWHGVYTTVARHGRETTANPWSLQEMTAAIAHERPDQRRTALLARLGDEPVGVGLLTLPLADNLATADVECMVLPEHRRRGVGTALLRVQEEAAAGAGRHVLFASAHEDGDDVDLGGMGFAAAHGYAVALRGAQSRLHAPVDTDALARLAADAAPHHAAYELRTFAGPVPDDVVESYAALDAVVDVEAPAGDLEIEPLDASVETWRAKEEANAAQGRSNVSTVALDARGEVVALTEIWQRAGEADVHQWSTIVRREDRGHRLGIAVKVANLLAALERWPDLVHVVTWNAEDNAHMLAVNDLLGFRVVERSADLQKRL